MTLTPAQLQLAHLLRRAGFGASPREWDAYCALGLEKTTEQLLHPERAPDTMGALQAQVGGDFVDYEDLNSVRGWWIYRMTHSNRPLEEKMTLFWHNHFATANYKVDSARRMWNQNETLRRYGLGDFRVLLQKMASDPAMLIWLDGAQSSAGAPNENFSREVMELFTLGRGGGYTETDIKEAARCFTGYRWADTPSNFVYDPGRHDDGEKTVLGQTGNWHSADVCDILARHPATARRLTGRLHRFFVGSEPSEEDSARLCATYFDADFEIRAVVREILTSKAFYAPQARYGKVKSPVEFAVMTLKTLGAPLSSARDISGALALMGQDLFNPPNVKGWNEGRDWINSRTLLARVNFASQLADEMNRRVSLLDTLRGLDSGLDSAKPGAAPGKMTPAAPQMMMGAAPMMQMNAAPQMMMGSTAPMMGASPPMMSSGAPTSRARASADAAPDEAVEGLWNALYRGMPMPINTRAALMKYASDDKPDATRIAEGKVQGLINLMMSLPEYQMC